MVNILVISLTLCWLTMEVVTATRPRSSSPTSSRYYRQNMYNFRPQSTLIDDEQDYRSYDNNFPDFRGGSQSYRSSPIVPLPQLTTNRHRPSYTTNSHFHDDDDYSNDSDLPDDDDDLNQGNPSYNFRPIGGPRPRPRPPLSQVQLDGWNDISGPGRGDASYSFGFDLHDQTRHEYSDPNGNVNGDFSFVDDEGTFRKISYTAGAHKGFVVQRKEPPDGQSLSSHRRPTNSIKLKPTIIPESPRFPPIRNPGISNQQQQQQQQHQQQQQQQQSSTDNNGDPDSSPPPSTFNNNKGSSGGSRLSGSNNNNRDHDNIGGSGGGSLSSGKPWGVLGQNQQHRPRYMRKRKPALVVKVKRPAQQQQQQPAWMYYRPPNPGRPVDGSSSNNGWQSKKPTLPNPTLPPSSSYQDDNDNGQWVDNSDNDIDDGYPKDKSYSFGYNTGDQTRQEVSDAWGNIRGSYSYLDPSGVTRTVHYTAGHSGFKILNAQPSILRPVFTEAPPVQSIPIPITVHHPQPSAIVYHIHPDGGIGADSWKPWEPTRIKHHGHSSQMYQRRRRNRPRAQQILQPNSFHLTHSNHRFFPAFSNIYDQSSSSLASSNHETDAETVLPTLTRHRIEEDPQFLKHVQQHIKHSNKLKRLQQQYKQQQQQQVFMYQRTRSPSLLSLRHQSRQKPIQTRFNVDSLSSQADDENLAPLDDQHFSDYEAAIVQSNPLTLKRKSQKTRQGNKGSHGVYQNQIEQEPQQQNSNKDSRNEQVEDVSNNNNDSRRSSSTLSLVDIQVDSTDPSNTDNTDPTIIVPTAKMEVEGEDHEIRPYNGGYGDKNPLLIITERESPAVRLQKKMSSDSRVLTSSRMITSSSNSGMTAPDNLVAESMVSPSMAMTLVMPNSDSRQMTLAAPPESKERVRMHRDHSMEKAMSKKKTTLPTVTTTSTSTTTWMSPAALLSAKMSSAPLPKMTSISAITIPGRLMHYPGAKLEPLNSKENEEYRN